LVPAPSVRLRAVNLAEPMAGLTGTAVEGMEAKEFIAMATVTPVLTVQVPVVAVRALATARLHAVDAAMSEVPTVKIMAALAVPERVNCAPNVEVQPVAVAVGAVEEVANPLVDSAALCTVCAPLKLGSLRVMVDPTATVAVATKA